MKKMIRCWYKGPCSRLNAAGKRIVFIAVLFLFLSASLLTACQNSDIENFPLIPANTEQEDEPDPNATEQTQEQTASIEWPEVDVAAELVVAVPFGQDALEMLRLYFLAEQSGLLNKDDDSHFGQQILLSNLQEFDGPLQLTLKTVSLDEGARAEDLAVWTASSSLPDILYGLHDQEILQKEHLLDLTPYLAEYPDLNPSHIYGSMLDAGRADTGIYGIPYLASIPLIYADYTFMLDQRVNAPDPGWSWQDFIDLSSTLQDKLIALEQDLSPDRIAKQSPESLSQILPQSRVVMADPLPMMAWLPALADEHLSWMAWSDGRFQMNHPAAKSSWAFISAYVDAGYTPYHLNEADKMTAGFDRPPAVNGRALLWIDSSAKLSSWHQQERFDVISFLVPAGHPSDLQNALDSKTADETLKQLADHFKGRRLPTDVRLLAVSRNSQYPDTAAALAAMIALDEDSLLIQSRYQLYEGYFPVVQSEVVWSAMVDRQIYGHFLDELRGRLNSVLINGGMLTGRQKLTETAAAVWLKLLEQQRISKIAVDVIEGDDSSETEIISDPAEPTDSEPISGQPDETIPEQLDEPTAEDPRSAAEILDQLSRDLNRIRGD